MSRIRALEEHAKWLLCAWRDHLVSESQVVPWADRTIEEFPPASDLPMWLIDLSMDGPARCMARPADEFLDVARPDFSDRFALHGVMVDLADESSVIRFARWVSRAAMGEDLDFQEVRFGYQVDHLLHDCQDTNGLVSYVRAELAALLEPRRRWAETIVRGDA